MAIFCEVKVRQTGLVGQAGLGAAYQLEWGLCVRVRETAAITLWLKQLENLPSQQLACGWHDIKYLSTRNDECNKPQITSLYNIQMHTLWSKAGLVDEQEVQLSVSLANLVRNSKGRTWESKLCAVNNHSIPPNKHCQYPFPLLFFPPTTHTYSDGD